MAETKRLVVLDTETTGTAPRKGDRVIEIGCVELLEGQRTGNVFHELINPEGKLCDPAAFRVHGHSDELLAKQKRWSEIMPAFLAFIKGAELVIHNADFDTDFINAELARMNLPNIWQHCAGVTCSLKIAQSKFLGQRNGLDALCTRLEVDNSKRTLHGALLDAELLSEVYLKMIADGNPFVDDEELAARARAPIQRLSKPLTFAQVDVPQDQASQHEAFLDTLEADSKSTSVWRSNALAAAAAAAAGSPSTPVSAVPARSAPRP